MHGWEVREYHVSFRDMQPLGHARIAVQLSIIFLLRTVIELLLRAVSQTITLSIMPSKCELPARFTPSLYKSKLLTEPLG